MKIAPTMIIASSLYREEVFGALNSSIFLKYPDNLASQFRQFISLNLFDPENFTFQSFSGESLVQFEAVKDPWDIRMCWNTLKEKQSDLTKTCDDLIRNLLDIGTSHNLLTDYDIDINRGVKVFILLSAFQPSESTFLSFFLRRVIPNLHASNIKTHIICYLPGQSLQNGDSNLYKRTYCCITEADQFLSDNQDTIDSFSFLSNTNERGDTINEFNNLIYTSTEYISKHFFNEDEVLAMDLKRIPLIERVRDKISLYSSFGTSVYVFHREKALVKIVNYLAYNTIDDYQRRLENSKTERELLYNQVELFIEENKWGRIEGEIERGLAFKQFSSSLQNKFIGIEDKSADSIVGTIKGNETEYLSPQGYFKREYLNLLHKNYKTILVEELVHLKSKIKLELKSSLEGFTKARSFLFSLAGREDVKAVTGEQFTEPVNLIKLRNEIADYYRKFLPETEKKINSHQISVQEGNLKNKLELASSIKERIDRIEQEILGWNIPVVEITQKEKNKLYFTINEQEININGYLEDNIIADGVSKFKSDSQEALPLMVDLRQYMTPVENQASVGSCVANALVSNYEYFIFRGTNQVKDLSRLFVYYNGRKETGTAMADVGSSVSGCLNGMQHLGTCLESSWPYDLNITNVEPNSEAYHEAKNYKVLAANYVSCEEVCMKETLAAGFPFVLSISIYDCFQLAGTKGIVPIPSQDEINSGNFGNHAMLCVGYSDIDRYFIVRNSWGQGWGDKGYCYIPYDFFSQPGHLSSDLGYLIRRVTDIKETEFKMLTACDRESLFIFGNDLIELSLFKKEYESLKLEIESLSTNLESDKIAFETQTQYVLNPLFRKDSQDKEVKASDDGFEALSKQLTENKEALGKLKKEKDEIVDLGKQLKFRLMALYPGIALAIFIAAIASITLFVPFRSVLPFVIRNWQLATLFLATITISYIGYSFLSYWRRVVKPNNAKQFEIINNQNESLGFVKQLYENRDTCFDILRQHRLLDLKLDFITYFRDYITKDLLREGFESWSKKLTELSEKFLQSANYAELDDNYFVRNAFNKNDLLHLEGKSLLDNILTSRKDFAANYLFNDRMELAIDSGLNKFSEDISNVIRNSEMYVVLNQASVFEFFFSRGAIKRVFPEIESKSAELNLKSLCRASYPLMELNNAFDSSQINSHFSLSLPDIDTFDAHGLADKCNSTYKEPIEEFNVHNNKHKDISQITVFRTRSIFPAYQVKSLQTSFQKYNADPDLTLFTDDQSAKYSFIPDEIKDLL